MRFIKHEEAPPGLLEFHKFRKVGDVAVHGEDTFGNDKRTLRLGTMLLKQSFQGFHVVMRKADALRARRLRPHHDGVVRKGVVKDHVLRTEELSDGRDVRCMTAHVDDAVLRIVETGNGVLEHTVRRALARNEARCRRTRTPALERIDRRLFKRRMTIQIQIVVSREVEEGFAVDSGFRLGNVIMALEERIQNPSSCSHDALHSKLLVGREFIKFRHFGIRPPLHGFKRTALPGLKRSGSGALQTRQKRRTVIPRKTEKVFTLIVAFLSHLL